MGVKMSEAKIIGHHRFWNVYDKMPEGWGFLEHVGMLRGNYKMIYNKKSYFSVGGRKTGLLKV